jgi:hypothetical protein
MSLALRLVGRPLVTSLLRPLGFRTPATGFEVPGRVQLQRGAHLDGPWRYPDGSPSTGRCRCRRGGLTAARLQSRGVGGQERLGSRTRSRTLWGCGDQPVLLDTSRWQTGARPVAGGPPEFRVVDNGGRPGSRLVGCRLGEQLQEAAPAAAGDPSRNATAEHPEARSRLRERSVRQAWSPPGRSSRFVL